MSFLKNVKSSKRKQDRQTDRHKGTWKDEDDGVKNNEYNWSGDPDHGLILLKLYKNIFKFFTKIQFNEIINNEAPKKLF